MRSLRENELRAGKDRLFDLGIEVGDLYFDVFVRQHVLTEGFGFFRDFVQQMRVYIGANAEAEDARVGFIRFRHGVDDLVLVGEADGGEAVGEKDYDIGTIQLVRTNRDRFPQGVIDGGASHWFELLYEVPGAGTTVVRNISQLVEKRLDLRRKAHDLKAVVAVEIINTEEERLFGLFQFVAGHGTGGIQNERNILRDDFSVLDFGAGRGEQDKITIFSGGLERHETDTEIRIFLRVEQLEIGIGFYIDAFEADR